MSPERQAEEGKVGPDFLPTSVHAKPVNYPVGKPLEVGRLGYECSSTLLFHILMVGFLVSPLAKDPHLTIAMRSRRIFLSC